MNELKKAIIEKAFEADGKMKLTCAQAFAIASKFNVVPSEIADLCNEENIRICTCQLKLFP